MKTTLLSASLLALVLTTGTSFAQATAPSAPATAPKTGDAAIEAKFVTADKNKSGQLDGAELDAMKADLAKIDSNKDGKVSKEEYLAATKAGVIK